MERRRIPAGGFDASFISRKEGQARRPNDFLSREVDEEQDEAGNDVKCIVKMASHVCDAALGSAAHLHFVLNVLLLNVEELELLLQALVLNIPGWGERQRRRVGGWEAARWRQSAAG